LIQARVASLEQRGAAFNGLDDSGNEHAAEKTTNASYSRTVAAVRACALGGDPHGIKSATETKERLSR